MVIACTGQTCAQMPQPLQYSKLIEGGIPLVMTASGQYSQQRKQPRADSGR